MKTKFLLALTCGLVAVGSGLARADETLNHWLSVASVNVSPAIEAGSEQVDPLSGMLTVTRRDIHLPGPAGLDIDVVRVYRSIPSEVGTNQQTSPATSCGNPTQNGTCVVTYGSTTDVTRQHVCTI